LREDWTSCTDIGKIKPKGTLTKAEYLRSEELYVRAVMAVVRATGSESILVHNIEFWETASDLLANLGLDDVFEENARPVEGDEVSGHRLENIVRRCLREVAWLELAAERRLLVHFGYDLRVIIASPLDLAHVLEDIRSTGLFVYDSAAQLPTLDTWAAG
jgi:hypothetical protein